MRSTGAWGVLVLAALCAACGNQQASGTACNREESWVRARKLADLAEGLAAQATGESLTSCEPEHYYRALAADRDLLKVNRPRVSVSSADAAASQLKTCMFVACDEGATHLEYCDADSRVMPIVSPLGFVGCCRTGVGSILPKYQCNNGTVPETSVDTAFLFVHTCRDDSASPDAAAPAPSAGDADAGGLGDIPYSLEVGF